MIARSAKKNFPVKWLLKMIAREAYIAFFGRLWWIILAGTYCSHAQAYAKIFWFWKLASCLEINNHPVSTLQLSRKTNSRVPGPCWFWRCSNSCFRFASFVWSGLLEIYTQNIKFRISKNLCFRNFWKKFWYSSTASCASWSSLSIAPKNILLKLQNPRKIFSGIWRRLTRAPVRSSPDFCWI